LLVLLNLIEETQQGRMNLLFCHILSFIDIKVF
jgi:hypothetical protein